MLSDRFTSTLRAITFSSHLQSAFRQEAASYRTWISSRTGLDSLAQPKVVISRHLAGSQRTNLLFLVAASN